MLPLSGTMVASAATVLLYHLVTGYLADMSRQSFHR